MIHSEKLSFQYNIKETLFQFPDILLEKEEHLLILGKSGIGKSTLLHLLAGLLKPKSGTICLNKTFINKLSQKELDFYRGQNIGFVFQKNHAIQSLNVLENLEARLYFSKKQHNTIKINKLLTELNLQEVKYSKPTSLSQGQLQRLSIALAVIHEPSVIFADEPTSSLDDENCQIVIQLLQKQANNTNAHLIVITHDRRIQPFFKKHLSL